MSRRLRPRSRSRPPHAGPTAAGVEVLRPEDAFFLYTQTSTVAQQVGGIAVLAEPSLTFSEVRAHVEQRLRELPALRRRLGPPRRRWGRPTWVPDDAPDLTRHLKERVVGAAGEPATFSDLVDEFFSAPLDVRRPPWEIHYVRGMEDGGAALIVKLHHAMGDGFAAIDMLSGLLDDARGSRARPPHAAGRTLPVPDRGDGPAGTWGGARLSGRLGGRIARRTTPQVRAQLQAGMLLLSGLWDLGRAGQAPRCSLNGPIRSPHRHVVTVTLPGADVRGTARRLEAATTELLLAAVADAIGRLLAARGDASRWVLAMVPRSMRTLRTRSAAGNWTGGARLGLPVEAMPPIDRLRVTQRRLGHALRYGDPQASRFLMRAMGALPGPMQRRVARWTYRSRWFNVIVSVIPGPRRPYTFAGVPLREVYPVLPLADEVGIAVGVLSWGDAVTVGVTTDVTLVPDAGRLADDLSAAFAELRDATTRLP